MISTEQKYTEEHFNSVANGKTSSSYEMRRWGADARVEQQRETSREYIEILVLPLIKNAKQITEVGAGPGTWTIMFKRANPKASFRLYDISSEMLTLAEAALKGSVVELKVGDFVEAVVDKESADFFFSSRAIEYFSDKQKSIHSISTMLVHGGSGAIVTKMPKRRVNMLLGRKPSSLHSHQIYPSRLAELLSGAGCKDIQLYPVTFAVPLFRSANLDRLAAHLFKLKKLSWISAFFAESYGVTFTKP